MAMLGSAGVMAIDTKVAGLTFRFVNPVMPDTVALTMVGPTATLVTRPLALTVATLGFEVLQPAEFVRSSVLPSLNIPVAVIC